MGSRPWKNEVCGRVGAWSLGRGQWGSEWCSGTARAVSHVLASCAPWWLLSVATGPLLSSGLGTWKVLSWPPASCRERSGSPGRRCLPRGPWLACLEPDGPRPLSTQPPHSPLLKARGSPQSDSPRDIKSGFSAGGARHPTLLCGYLQRKEAKGTAGPDLDLGT